MTVVQQYAGLLSHTTRIDWKLTRLHILRSDLEDRLTVQHAHANNSNLWVIFIVRYCVVRVMTSPVSAGVSLSRVSSQITFSTSLAGSFSQCSLTYPVHKPSIRTHVYFRHNIRSMCPLTFIQLCYCAYRETSYRYIVRPACRGHDQSLDEQSYEPHLSRLSGILQL
jgi:hypothetical protein